MWSTVKERSTIPSLPSINPAHSDDQFPQPTLVGGGTLAERMNTLEVSNKALLEEMVHVHAAIRKEKEETKKLLSEVVLETKHQLQHCQSSSEDVMSQGRRIADRITRMERSLLGMEGVLKLTQTDKEKQETWLKDSFSSVHDRVSWLTNKMEGTVIQLTNTLKSLKDSLASKHTEFAANTEEKHTLTEKKITQLEKEIFENHDRSKQLSAIVGQVKDELNALTESYTSGCKDDKFELSSLRESLGGLARESTTHHIDLSTVLEAEIKTRQKVLSDVRGQCAQLQVMCRDSVQTLREGLVSAEEKITLLKKEVVASQEQQITYCQELVHKLHNDMNIQLTSLHHQLQNTVREPVQVALTDSSLPTIVEEDFDSEKSQNKDEQKVEHNRELLSQSRVLLDQSEELKTTHQTSKKVLEELQLNLKQSEQLLKESKMVQSNLELKKHEYKQENLEASNQILEQLQVKLNTSDQVQSTLDQSKVVLDELRAQLEQTKQASDQIQSNLNRSKSVLEQLQSNVIRSQSVLEEKSNVSQDEIILERDSTLLVNNHSPQLSEHQTLASTHTQSFDEETTELDGDDRLGLEPDEVAWSSTPLSARKQERSLLELKTPESDSSPTSNGPSPLLRTHTGLDPMHVSEENLNPAQGHSPSTERTPSQVTPTPHAPSQVTPIPHAPAQVTPSPSQITPSPSQTTPTPHAPSQVTLTPSQATPTQVTSAQDKPEASDAGDSLILTMEGSAN